jgi:alkanesulfonate monooxygenase SsuD/methylene tetrahydromethanopterin reductase-like flavin-dependent oxidoreductase (luciferase family)
VSISFGFKTPPVHTSYAELLRVWEEADAIPQLEHGWLWDHFLPLFGDPTGPILEGWTLLSALAARTSRLELGLMVTGNAARLPAVLGKMATTVDVISGGRLVLGIGVGATALDRPGQELAVREYEAYGLPLVPPDDGIERLAETLHIVRRMWTDDVFDFAGRHFRLEGCVNEPKPVRRPPVLIGAWGRRALKVVAEYADIWNVPGPPHNGIEYLASRARILDEHCAAIGRDPAGIVRSAQVVVSYSDPGVTRESVVQLAREGFSHIVLNLGAPYPPNVARWLVDEIIDHPDCVGAGAAATGRGLGGR